MPIVPLRPRSLLLTEPRILLEDGPLLAVDKPAGWLTQGTPDRVPSVEAWVKAYLKSQYNKTGNVYLGMPHRLDRPVSGVLVFARNSKAAARLAEQFRERTVRKIYHAWVPGTVGPSEGELVDWLVKHAEEGRVEAVPTGETGKESRLRYRVLEGRDGFTLLELEPLTGRTHQLRVQLAHHGWPIVGDVQYGGPEWPASWSNDAPGRIALHACRLTLKHPIRYDEVSLVSETPRFDASTALPITELPGTVPPTSVVIIPSPPADAGGEGGRGPDEGEAG